MIPARAHRFLVLLKKEALQLLKNPKTRITVFAPPVLQLFLLGYAATMDLKEVPVGVLDRAGTVESRALIAEFAGSPAFVLRPPLESENDMRRRMDRKEIKLALVVPPDFSRELAARRAPVVQTIVDGRNSFSAGIAAGYANEAIGRFSRTLFPEMDSGVRTTVRNWHNPNSDAQFFMVPSLLAVLTLVTLTLLAALSFAKERENGTMDQLLMTPYSPAELLAAKGISVMGAGAAQLAFCMLFVRFWFKIPYMSDAWLLLLLFFLLLFASVGVGLAISVLCDTLQQAMIRTFLVVVPFVMLSGMATPVESMPPLVEKAMRINPIRWSIDSLHRLFLEGAVFRDVLPTYLILGGIGAGSFALACAVFLRQRRL